MWNINNGAQLERYSIPAPRLTRDLPERRFRAAGIVGDRVIIASFQWTEEVRAAEHHPKLVFVDGRTGLSRTATLPISSVKPNHVAVQIRLITFQGV